jgi:hypothetical protein
VNDILGEFDACHHRSRDDLHNDNKRQVVRHTLA